MNQHLLSPNPIPPYAQSRPHDDALPAHVTCVMDVNLGAIQGNYRSICDIVGPKVTVAPVVKANAYGFGLEPITQTLWASGARSFFVADVNEGIILRRILPGATICLLAGLWEGIEGLCEEYHLVPVLIHKQQVALWQKWALRCQKILPAILHVDTGMRRTGLPLNELQHLAQRPHPFEGLDLQVVMSHLACSTEPDHLLNMKQLKAFKETLTLLPGVKASLSGSGGIFMGATYHFDYVRPGMVIYGLPAHGMISSASIQPCLRIAARILQIQEADTGETVGYNATYRFSKPTRIATIALGYADGYLRPLSNQGVAMLHGHVVPIVGRISMDLLTLDISQVPTSLAQPGQWVDIVNDQISIQDVAQRAHTIPYEVLVRLGPRYHRRYYTS